MTRRARWLAGTGIVLLAIAAAGSLVLQSRWLKEQIRQRVIAEAEKSSGGRLELGPLEIDWLTLRATVAPVIFRGTEPQTTAPLFRADRLELDVDWRILQPRRWSLEALLVDRPAVNILVYPDGSTNIPSTKRQGRPLPETLLDLAIGRLELRNGEVRIDQRQLPLDIRASGVEATATMDRLSRRYTGSVRAARIDAWKSPASVRADLALTPASLELSNIEAKLGSSRLSGVGWLRDWSALSIGFDLAAEANAAELAQMFSRPEVTAGRLAGPVRIRNSAEGWRVEAEPQLSQLGLRIGQRAVSGVSGTGKVAWAKSQIAITDAVLQALGGRLTGGATILRDGAFSASGELSRVVWPGPLATAASGPFRITGSRQRLDSAELRATLAAVSGAVPASGQIDLRYDARTNSLLFRPSTLRAASTDVHLEGSLERGLLFDLETRNLEELLAAVQTLTGREVKSPVTLSGPARARGEARGSTANLTVTATASASGVRFRQYELTDVALAGSVNAARLQVDRASARWAGASLDGAASLPLQNWEVADHAPLQGRISVRSLSLPELARRKVLPQDVGGTGSGEFVLSGNLAQPNVSGSVRIDSPAWRQTKADRLSARLSFDGDSIALSDAVLEQGPNQVKAAARYRRSLEDWSAGDLFVDVLPVTWTSAQWLGSARPVTLRGQGILEGRLTQSGFAPVRIDGQASATVNGSGQAILKATTSGGALALNMNVTSGSATLSGDGRWQLSGRMPGSGTLRMRGVTPEILRNLAELRADAPELPFQGLIEGTAQVEGYLTEPQSFAARALLTTVRFAPRRENVVPGLTAADLTVRNDGDIIVALARSGAVIERARFVAKDTELEGRGTLLFRPANSWNAILRGRVNLAVFSTFNPNLLSTGVSTVSARFRGAWNNPLVDGRMQFANAAFSLRDVPNGLENVNGAILFDRTRATIESLTAQTGGGQINLRGFVGFGGPEVSYQLQAQAERVRIRYPEGFSTQANAQLSLTGSSRRGLLSGWVTVLRAGLVPTPEGAAALPRPAAPVSVGQPNSFLENLHFDVRVETAQSAELATSLTRGVQADIDLRLRGTAERPTVLGRISVTQGTVDFFGTRYTINRGEINFVNPVQIEPRVDLDLETRIRGIVVSINLTGPLRKLNLTYRSDPPLQSRDILALIAVGRTPVTSNQSSSLSADRSLDLLGGGGGTAVLNSAIGAGPGGGANSRLQRFFGISRVKIDPQLIGLNNTPQARLSVEQQISRDVTVTYVTSLNSAQSQFVQVQWDFSRSFSALATREENGVISVDFLYRRNFR